MTDTFTPTRAELREMQRTRERRARQREAKANRPVRVERERRVVPTPGEATPRAAMTPSRKARIHKLRAGLCMACGFPVEVAGPTVIYDHDIPLELGGADEDHNIGPLHAEPCNKAKTRADQRRIAKAKRQARQGVKKSKGRPLRSRGFQ